MINFLNKILRRQTIIDVNSWDGSASNYSTAQAYAKSSLMNFNTGDPDTWVKGLIKLPVRRENDGSDVYVRQAIYAAAGGRGITAVTKPDGVSQDEFDKQKKSAANEIIKAYNQMKETAPQSVYDIAGKERPETQAVSFEELCYRIYDALYLIEEATGSYIRLIDCFLMEDGSLLAVVVQDGKLYKQHFILDGDTLLLDDYKEIPLEEETSMAAFQVVQQSNGKYRWVGIAATTALNKNGVFNSKKLYDSFIDHINQTGEYPILNFYHQANTRLGIADFAARDDNLYILSGMFDDNEFGKAAAQGLQADPEYWGQSIEFWPDEMDWYIKQIDSNTTVRIPIYTAGVNDATSIVPAHDAACLGTGIISQNKYSGGNDMNGKVKETLQKLIGVELAEEFEELADGENQHINEATVHQTVTVEEEEVEETEQVEEFTELETEEIEDVIVELDERFIDDMLTDLTDHDGFIQMIQERINAVVNPLLQQIQKLQNQVNTLQTAQQATEQALQESETEQRERWEQDLPNRTVVSYRPRRATEAETPGLNRTKSYAEMAANTLKSKVYGG